MRRLLAAAFLAALLTLSMTLSLFSCGYSGNSEEIIDALTALAPEARELYGIIYGDGLSHSEKDENGYCEVAGDAKYRSVAELKIAMNEVFSTAYMQVLFNTAFNGVSADEGSIESKFTERNGKLYVNPSVTEDFGDPREFDLSRAEVKKQNRYKAIVSVPVLNSDETIEVTMQKESGGWRIDSALY